jgi:thiol-disulfide isomerase/thioredoxin
VIQDGSACCHDLDARAAPEAPPDSSVDLKGAKDPMTTNQASNQAPNAGRSRWRWAVNLLLILAIFMLVHTWRTQPLAEGPAPPLTGRSISDGQLDLAQLRGEPVLVHFWATWCPVCKMGDQDIDTLADEFRVISVAMQSGGARDIAAYMDREGLDFPVIPDEYGSLASAWGVQAVPATFVVDGDGQIRFSTMGYTTEIGLRSRLWAAR